MIMLLKKLWPLLILPFLVSTQAKADNERGNGGGAFVCRNSLGKIISSETMLVDLYEASAKFDLTVKRERRLTLDEQIDLAAFRIQTIDNNFYLQLAPHLEKVRQILRVVSNAQLENTNDFDIRVSPKTCLGGKIKFEQLANYTEEGQLLVDEDIWKFLRTTDKAALYIHEAVYSYLRSVDMVITSKRARQITAYTFSNPSRDAFKLLLSAAILTGIYECQSDLHIGIFSIAAESPTFGEKIPTYVLRADISAIGGYLGINRTHYWHDLKLKEVSYEEYKGDVVASIKHGTVFKTLNGGHGSARRVVDGSLIVEMNWAAPFVDPQGQFDNLQVTQSIEMPSWWYVKKFINCKRTGGVKN